MPPQASFKNAIGTLSQASKKTFIHAAVAYIKKT
jgi:hypothetical protein